MGLALFWGAAFGLARWLGGGAGRQALALALTLSLAELGRAHLLTGFPWAGFAQGLIDTPFAALSAHFGAEGLAVTLLLAVALCIWIAERTTAWAYPVGLAALAAITYLPPAAPLVTTDGPIIRLVQPNAPQTEKWDPDRAPVFFDRMLRATGVGTVPALVVWPETAIPYLLEYAGPALDDIADAARGAPVVVGINRREGARYHNSLLVIGRGGAVQATYDKVHLVPFGEYVPLGDWLVPFGITTFAASQGGGFSPGTASDLIDLPGVGLAQALICYEGIFGDEINAVAQRPRLLLLITNDAWFGPDAGPLQHLAQARLRAIEQGLPMVRVANTGVSAMIDGHGTIVASLGMGQAGALDVALPAALPPTLYSRIGDWPLRLLLGLAVLALLTTRRRIPVDPGASRP
jgi:apolipoprotein N-acyltransferase